MPKTFLKNLPKVIITYERTTIFLKISEIAFFLIQPNNVLCYTDEGFHYRISKTLNELTAMPLFSGFLIFDHQYFVNEKYLDSISVIDGETKIIINAKKSFQISLSKQFPKPVLMKR